MTQYSLPYLLRGEDRNSMAHSIEARVPFTRLPPGGLRLLTPGDLQDSTRVDQMVAPPCS